MKKHTTLLTLTYSLLILLLCSCGAKKDDSSSAPQTDTELSTENSMQIPPDASMNSSKANPPDLSQIRSICELATLECYYHNVAKSVQEKGTGISHIGEVDRAFWIEYSGTAKLGVDMSKVTMTIDENTVFITIPKAEVLGLSNYSFAPDNYISSDDGINKNPITAENQTKAIAKADEDIRLLFASNEALLMRAQNRARLLIENYINQLNEISGTEYRIEWIYDTASEAPPA